jgi:hypothetical protein
VTRAQGSRRRPVSLDAEFEKNPPFALDIAKSAQNPYEPVSRLGNTAPDDVLDEFDVSHGQWQIVEATISRQIRNTFTVQVDPDQVLILAKEDYDGYTPEQGLAGPASLDDYTDALEANHIRYDVWDTDAHCAPHPLGVLACHEATCASPGPTGEFHAFNGSSDGWIDVSFDRSAYAGSQVEISLT